MSEDITGVHHSAVDSLLKRRRDGTNVHFSQSKRAREIGENPYLIEVKSNEHNVVQSISVISGNVRTWVYNTTSGRVGEIPFKKNMRLLYLTEDEAEKLRIGLPSIGMQRRKAVLRALTKQGPDALSASAEYAEVAPAHRIVCEDDPSFIIYAKEVLRDEAW